MPSLKIESRQAEVEALHAEIFGEATVLPAPTSDWSPLDLSDEDLLIEARIAKNGAKFESLYIDGDTSEYGDDHSCADLGLCKLLAFWCGPDPTRIDRLFRASALMREKWNSKRGDMTYGWMTIEKALSLTTDFYSPHYSSSAKADATGAVPPEGGWAGHCGGSKGPTQGEILTQIAAAAEPFHTPDREAYVRVRVGDHFENWLVSSTAFREWLTRGFYLREGKPPSASQLQDVIRLTEARARFDSAQHLVSVRVAKADGLIYIDLGDERWDAVEIGPDGWKIVSDPPVRFRRSANTAAFPRPVPGGSLEELSDFINVVDDRSFKLVGGWLVGALNPDGPYSLIALEGEQGSAKSTVAKICRSLVDPCHVPICTAPRNEQDLLIAAQRSWVLSYDNLSHFPNWLSDAFCRLATGGGYSARRLYTDSEEVILRATRPIILNGIANLTSRQDLADRTMSIYLPAIPAAKRITEKELWRKFEKARPRILGALYDAVSAALRNLPQVELVDPPRMADFAQWVVAAEEALPWPAGSFLAAYRANRDQATRVALEHDPVVVAVSQLLEDSSRWDGTAADLLEVLRLEVTEQLQKSRG